MTIHDLKQGIESGGVVDDVQAVVVIDNFSQGYRSIGNQGIGNGLINTATPDEYAFAAGKNLQTITSNMDTLVTVPHTLGKGTIDKKDNVAKVTKRTKPYNEAKPRAHKGTKRAATYEAECSAEAKGAEDLSGCNKALCDGSEDTIMCSKCGVNCKNRYWTITKSKKDFCSECVGKKRGAILHNSEAKAAEEFHPPKKQHTVK